MSHMTYADEIHALETSLARVKEERDALAAHVERISILLGAALDYVSHDTIAGRELHDDANKALISHPTT